MRDEFLLEKAYPGWGVPVFILNRENQILYQKCGGGNNRRPAPHGNGDTGACKAHSGKAEETDRGRICRTCVFA